jgi:hypothetical protein
MGGFNSLPLLTVAVERARQASSTNPPKWGGFGLFSSVLADSLPFLIKAKASTMPLDLLSQARSDVGVKLL